jgi:hypothetical protein
MDLGSARDLANRLLLEHGLHGWRVELDGAKTRAGVCRYADRVIGLSAPLTRLHDDGEVRDTLLHEIAHALVGPEHKHDGVWRATALRIGCSGRRCVDAEAPRVGGAWVGVCQAGHVKERHRRPERVVSCGRCSSTFSADHVLDWTHRGRPAVMHPNYVAELAALRSGERLMVVAPGGQVRISAPGAYTGRVGRVLKRGRTSYHVQLREGVLRVPFAGVVPAD